ncbi:MAG: hypothetical protein ACRDAM_03350, partial [Casimicrobium sp.]
PYHLRSVRSRWTGKQFPVNVARPHEWLIDKAAVTVALVGRALTITFPTNSEPLYKAIGPHNGDVLIDSVTGMVFFVHSFSGLTLAATAQNNYKPGGATVAPFSTTTGTLHVINSRLYTPDVELYGDITSGSATVTNVQRADGAVYSGADMQVGDLFYALRPGEEIIEEQNAPIVARNFAAKTMTATNPFSKTQSQRRLGLFVRKPPVNV